MDMDFLDQVVGEHTLCETGYILRGEALALEGICRRGEDNSLRACGEVEVIGENFGSGKPHIVCDARAETNLHPVIPIIENGPPDGGDLSTRISQDLLAQALQRVLIQVEIDRVNIHDSGPLDLDAELLLGAADQACPTWIHETGSCSDFDAVC